MNIGFFGLLQLIFIVLKVTNLIDWSWWLVFSPVYTHVIIYSLVVAVVVPWLDKKDPLWRMRK